MSNVNEKWQENWNQFGKLKCLDDLRLYFGVDREFRHENYFHYTSSTIIESIIENKQIWVSSVKSFNDTNDSEQFGTKEEQSYYFSLCFSTGINENLPLWYMYSGMNGQGGRIKITKGYIKTLFNNNNSLKCTLWEKEKKPNGKIGLKKGSGKSLRKDEDYSIEFKDILYYRMDDSKNMVDIKYNTMTNYNITKYDFEKYISENKGFFKSLVWYYEKETRLIIKLIDNAKNLIDKNKEYVITIDLDGITPQNFSVMLAPEITDEEFRNVSNFMLEKAPKIELKKSKYHGTVKMNFCSKCNNSKNHPPHNEGDDQKSRSE